MDPWIDWVRRLQHVSETGLTYATDPYDIKRYEEVARLAAEGAGQGAALDTHGAGHPTPKVDVRGALARDGKVLLVREVADGGWTLPGGWADIGQPASRAAGGAGGRARRRRAAEPLGGARVPRGGRHPRPRAEADRRPRPGRAQLPAPRAPHLQAVLPRRGDRRAARRARRPGRRRRLGRAGTPPPCLALPHP